MANGSPFAFNFLFLLFLLVPGYLTLKGYLSATLQLDSMSRLDKILTAVIGGVGTFTIMNIIYRFGVLQFLVDYWYEFLLREPITAEIGYNSTNKITTSTINNVSALSIIGFITAQSILAYTISYLAGTVTHIRSAKPQKSDKDIQQPWETAFRQSALGDRVTVITSEGSEIKGTIYRIGSPSEDYDLLLSAAERVLQGSGTEPLGITYHHYDDISQVRFPDIKPDPSEENGNWILRRIKSARIKIGWAKHKTNELRYREDRLEEKIQAASECGTLLNNYVYLSEEHDDE